MSYREYIGPVRPPAGEAPRTEHAIDWPESWTPADIAWVKRQIIGEYRREAASAAPPEPPRPPWNSEKLALWIHYTRHGNKDPDYIMENAKERANKIIEGLGVAAPEGLDVERLRELAVEVIEASRSNHPDKDHRLDSAIRQLEIGLSVLSESGSPTPNYDTDIIEPALDDRDRGESGSPTPPHDDNRATCWCYEMTGIDHPESAPTPPGEERP